MKKPWFGLFNELEDTVGNLQLVRVFVWVPSELQAPQCLFPLCHFQALVHHRLHFLENGALDLVDRVVFKLSIKLRGRGSLWRHVSTRLIASLLLLLLASARLVLLSRLRTSSLLRVPLCVLLVPLLPLFMLLPVLLLLLPQVRKRVILVLGLRSLRGTLTAGCRLPAGGSRRQGPGCMVCPLIMEIDLPIWRSVTDPVRGCLLLASF
mmetsp:Transcript_54155/g.126451  ORF Transcript_54155/g.126451 Transcript_54155/m.126451 type:complete len:208 (-) Transcript_54155:377-1000(-)